MLSALDEHRQSRAHELCHKFKIVASDDSGEYTSEYITNMHLWIQENLEFETYIILLTVNNLNHAEILGIDITFYNEITAMAFKLTWE